MFAGLLTTLLPSLIAHRLVGPQNWFQILKFSWLAPMLSFFGPTRVQLLDLSNGRAHKIYSRPLSAIYYWSFQVDNSCVSCFILIVSVRPHFVCLWLFVHFGKEYLVIICTFNQMMKWMSCWLSFCLISSFVLMFLYVSFCGLGRMWNLIVSVLDHLLFIYFTM